MGEPWNANIHYDRRLDACVPETARSVLDVGCGDGFLSARLARRVPRVVGLDTDAAVLERARARFPDAKVSWQRGDVLTHPFAPGSFDAVVSNATLHHLPDAEVALRRMAGLVRPGGTLAVVGFARMEPRDRPWYALALLSLGVANRVRGKWEHTAPQVWPPRDSVRELREVLREVTPGARISRLVMGRYLIRWRAPEA